VRHAEQAIDAFLHFGKSVHAAGLNYGDCFAFALAEATGEPLLFKGDHFALTDTAPCEAHIDPVCSAGQTIAAPWEPYSPEWSLFCRHHSWLYNER
jgi:hypothetical protein